MRRAFLTADCLSRSTRYADPSSDPGPNLDPDHTSSLSHIIQVLELLLNAHADGEWADAIVAALPGRSLRPQSPRRIRDRPNTIDARSLEGAAE